MCLYIVIVHKIRGAECAPYKDECTLLKHIRQNADYFILMKNN